MHKIHARLSPVWVVLVLSVMTACNGDSDDNSTPVAETTGFLATESSTKTWKKCARRTTCPRSQRLLWMVRVNSKSRQREKDQRVQVLKSRPMSVAVPPVNTIVLNFLTILGHR